MRILIVSTDYLPLIGGVAQHVSELARALHQGGDEVVVLTVDRLDHWADLRRPTREEPATPDRPRVVRVPWVVNRRIKLVTGLASSRLSCARFLREVHALAADFRPEVIHWHAVDLWRDALWRGIPAARVWTNHTSDFITGLNRRGLRRRYTAEARAADRIIAPSEQLRALTVALGVPDDRAHFISNGVDPDRFPPGADGTAWRDRLALRPDERRSCCARAGSTQERGGPLLWTPPCACRSRPHRCALRHRRRCVGRGQRAVCAGNPAPHPHLAPRRALRLAGRGRQHRDRRPVRPLLAGRDSLADRGHQHRRAGGHGQRSAAGGQPGRRPALSSARGGKRTAGAPGGAGRPGRSDGAATRRSGLAGSLRGYRPDPH
jgi:glycosyltransferase involved in cell wall biosynthesis